MTRSVFVHLMGGLGNQLFQLAAAYSLSKVCSAGLRFDPVTGFRGDFRFRRAFELHDVAAALGGKSDTRPGFHGGNPAFRCRLWLRRNCPCLERELVTDEDWSIHLPREIAERSDKLSLYGYFQRLGPILSLRAEFREKTKLPSERHVKYPRERIAVHCRLTDIDYPPSSGYIGQALKRAVDRHGYRQVHIVSDDMRRAASIVRSVVSPRVEIVANESRSVWEDFWAIASADCQILSKSTFGWWAAFLGDASTVIYPRADDSWWKSELMLREWEEIK